MVLNKQLGKLFSRKKPEISPKKIDSENKVADTALSSKLEGESIELGISKLEA